MSSAYKQGPSNCLQSIWRHYVHNVFSSVDAPALTLIADDVSMDMINVAVTMSDLTSYRVYDVLKLSQCISSKKDHHKMTAVILVKPGRASHDDVVKIIRERMFEAYHIVYTNLCSETYINDLAREDRHGAIRSIKEIFADYITLDSHLFLVSPPSLRTPLSYGRVDHAWMDAMIQSVTAVAASLRTKPFIRYQANSRTAAALAAQTWSAMNIHERDVYAFGGRAPEATLLILDRSGDPLTPLLLPWTYESMIHEHLGIEKNTVAIAGKERMVLGTNSDEFYKRHLGENWGEVVDSVQGDVQRAAAAQGKVREMKTLQDMQAFISGIGDMNAAKQLVAKHFSIVQELLAMIDGRGLMDASAVEQALASSSDGPAADLASIDEVLRKGGKTGTDVARLALLYAIRHEGRVGERQKLAKALSESGLDPDRSIQAAMGAVLDYAGSKQRQDDILGQGMKARLKRAATSVSEVESVFTLHKPLLKAQLEDCSLGRLDTQLYPFKDSADGHPAASMVDFKRPMREVIVLMVGGATYSEALVVSKFNESSTSRNSHAILGSPVMLTTRRFIDLVKERGVPSS